MPQAHQSIREGATLGLLVATTIWLWLAIVDALVGRPFQTFTVLGGVFPFTAFHYLLNVAYGIAVVSVIHRAEQEPSLVIGVAFGFLVLEFAFVMLTLLLSHLGLGALAWLRILGGNVIGAAIGWSILFRTHPLREELREAEEQETE
jgi:hypothetical protein